MKKRALLFISVIGLVASLSAQSLVELAKQEKARREALKGNHAPVIKKADLLRVRKAPAVEIVREDVAEGELGLESSQLDATGAEALEPESEVMPSGSGAPSGRRIQPRVAAAGPVIMGGEGAGESAASAGPLEAQLKAANELVDLLTTKMAALRQQFEAQDSMVPGYVIQQQLDETNQRLVKAQTQQTRIEAQVAKGAGARKAPGDSQR